MELLLNLFWLMLALPAVMIWRRDQKSARTAGRRGRSQCFVLLSCVLALLFPIISATDDLHPTRAEIEESSPSKRVAKLSPSPSSPTLGNSGGPPAQLLHAASFTVKNEVVDRTSAYVPVLPDPGFASTTGGRPPPAS
ncbi:MAG: hypothetical protein WB421_04515 [Terriglobales bacterium]|jgi:hypothetical protein